MYLHCKRGFVEADRWDGSKIPDAAQHKAVKQCKRDGGTVIVVRSRELETLQTLLGDVGISRPTFESPPGWDYQFRAYVTIDEWARVLAGVAFGLDYRNFKSWTSSHRPDDHRLAFKIWQAAYDAGGPLWPLEPVDVVNRK
jgi:hypothetical protein